MKSVEIPGGTAILRDKQDFRVKHERLVNSAAVAAAPILTKMPDDIDKRLSLTEREVIELGATREEIEAMFELQDATIVAALAEWTLDAPLPNMDTIGDLTADVYEALAQATARTGAEVAVEKFDPSPDVSSPTEPSGDSGSQSRAEQESPLTGAQQSSGESSTSGAASPA